MYDTGICLERLSKTTKIDQDIWYPSKDLNRTPSQYKPRALPLHRLGRQKRKNMRSEEMEAWNWKGTRLKRRN
jgi:hypothetical protein